MKNQNLLTVYLQKNCPICDSVKLKPVKTEQNLFSENDPPTVKKFSHSWVQLLECTNCHFAFCKEVPTNPDFFKERYNLNYDHNFEGNNIFKNNILITLIDLLKRHDCHKGKLLDIGSFAGIFLLEAQKEGFEVEGIEVNPHMCQYTREKLGLKVINASINSYEGPHEKYDVITLIDVLEHLYDPLEVIEKCFKSLKPGGLLLIKVPNYRPQKFKQTLANLTGINRRGIFSNFGHINQFSPSSLNYLLKKTGLNPLKCIIVESEKWAGNSPIVIFKNFGRKTVYIFTILIKMILGINIGLNIAILAQRPAPKNYD